MCSGRPPNFLRSSGSCVATPTGHLFWWHTRAMTQPSASRTAVPKANSSAPSAAATTTSWPVRRSPSTRNVTCSRKPAPMRARWTSARPSSHGMPACLIEFSDAAAVPPPPPETWITSAPALATPAAMVPMPVPATSFTEMPARGLTMRRS